MLSGRPRAGGLSRAAGGLAMLLAGGAHTAAFAPWELWWLQLLALAALAWAVAAAAPRRAAWLGGCFSLGWLASGLWWLYISLHDFGGLAPALAVTAVLLLAAALSLYVAGAMALWARLRSGRPLPDGLLFAACWLLAELARAQFFTGFPWIASGYAHSTGPLAALAPWVGVYGMGAAAALLAAALATVAQRGLQGAPLLLLAMAAPMAAVLAPADFTVPAGSLRVSLLQPNVAQHLKFDPDRIIGNMAAFSAQVQAAKGDLVLTPESVVPLPLNQLDPAYLAQLTEGFRSGGRAALIGVFTGSDEAGYVNSLWGVSGATEDYVYGKRHLLPFGEYMPPGFRWFVELLNIPLGDQATGTQTAPFLVGGQRVRPLICYEDLFGEDFAGSLVGPQAATMLVNATNLAWFGRHMVQDQHLQFSRLRALEFQRPLARATNTGATALVDHRGQVSARLPPVQAGILEVTVEGRQGSTPYARWLARFGLWPLWVAVVVGLLLALRVQPQGRWRRA